MMANDWEIVIVDRDIPPPLIWMLSEKDFCERRLRPLLGLCCLMNKSNRTFHTLEELRTTINTQLAKVSTTILIYLGHDSY